MTKDKATITAKVLQPVELRAICVFTSDHKMPAGTTLAVDDAGHFYGIMENGNAWGAGPLEGVEAPGAPKPRQRISYTTEELATQAGSILVYLEKAALMRSGPVPQAEVAKAMVDAPGFERAVSQRAVETAVEAQCFVLSEDGKIKRRQERRRWYVEKPRDPEAQE